MNRYKFAGNRKLAKRMYLLNIEDGIHKGIQSYVYDNPVQHILISSQNVVLTKLNQVEAFAEIPGMGTPVYFAQGDGILKLYPTPSFDSPVEIGYE